MNKNLINKYIIQIISLVILVILLNVYSVGEKLGRFIDIASNITHSLIHAKHAYENIDINISDEELNDINISKISKEIKSSIDKRKDVNYQKAPIEIPITEIREEENPIHNKTKPKEAKLINLKDIPQKLKPLKQFLHEPFKMGACQICHDIKEIEKGKLIKKSIEDVCYSCHKTRYTKKIDHQPVKDGKCTSCHDPHQSNIKNLLKANSTNELCIKCHDNKSTNKLKANKQFININLPIKHKPLEDKSCLECHDAHTAEYKSLLNLDGKQDLCLDCHDDEKDKVEYSKFKHGGVTTNKKCLECHNPHASKYKKLLKRDSLNTCLSCHNKEIKLDKSNGVLVNIKKHLDENQNWHMPIKDSRKHGGCGACHDPHGSDNFSILKKSFTKNFYDNFENKDFFCFKCHNMNKITEKYIQVNDANITNFRDGEVNLHHLHVNDRKGRSCRACHDEHASKYDHLLRKHTIFNGIKFPLRYIHTQTGGSCAPACHTRFEYDRINPKGIGLSQ